MLSIYLSAHLLGALVLLLHEFRQQRTVPGRKRLERCLPAQGPKHAVDDVQVLSDEDGSGAGPKSPGLQKGRDHLVDAKPACIEEVRLGGPSIA